MLIVSAVNSPTVLQQNLLASPALARRELPLTVYVDQPSASQAYNLALSETCEEIVIFAHQDVYLPDSFVGRLRAAIRELDARVRPAWAVLGVYGVTADGRRVGRAWCSGNGRVLGMPFADPIPVVSLDEILIVVRRSSGLRFDNDLPGFHLYGTDIAQAALAGGFGAYVVHAPVIHNSDPSYLTRDYWRAYRHLASRWQDRLPIPTCIVPVWESRWPEIHYRANQRWELLFGPRPAGKRHKDPATIAQRLAF